MFVCVYLCVSQCYFVARKLQIIAHEMLFIQSSSSVTIPLLQHSTAYWRNTTEQISVKITVCKSHKGSLTYFISEYYCLLQGVLFAGDKERVLLIKTKAPHRHVGIGDFTAEVCNFVCRKLYMEERQKGV